MRYLSSIYLTAGILLTAAGCGEKVNTAPPMRFDSAVVEAHRGGDSASGPVAGGYRITPSGDHTDYGQSLAVGASDTIHCQYVGQANYLTGPADQYNLQRGDVYMVNIIQKGGGTTNFPVVYKGKKIAVYDKGGLVITIHPENVSP